MMNQLEIWQQQNNVSNRDLAKKVPCHESLVSKYHKRKRNFSPKKALRISTITGLPVTVIIYRN